MSIARRIGFLLCLMMAVWVTVRSGDYIVRVLNGLLENALLAQTFTKTIYVAVWSWPLIIWPGLRDVGSLHLRWTWTVLLTSPWLVLIGVTYSFAPVHHDWRTSGLLVWRAFSTASFEELVFRGYAFRQSPGKYPRLIIILSASAYSFLHLINLATDGLDLVVQMVCFTFFLGLGCGIVRMVSGSLGWCILLHGSIDAGVTFLRGYPTVFGYGHVIPLAYLVEIVCTLPMLAVIAWHPRLRARVC